MNDKERIKQLEAQVQQLVEALVAMAQQRPYVVTVPTPYVAPPYAPPWWYPTTAPYIISTTTSSQAALS